MGTAQGRSQGTPKGLSKDVVGSGVFPSGVKWSRAYKYKCTCIITEQIKNNLGSRGVSGQRETLLAMRLPGHELTKAMGVHV